MSDARVVPVDQAEKTVRAICEQMKRGNIMEAMALFMRATMPAPQSQPEVAGVSGIIKAAQAVVWFDWSGNDSDACQAIDNLSKALSLHAGGQEETVAQQGDADMLSGMPRGVAESKILLNEDQTKLLSSRPAVATAPHAHAETVGVPVEPT